MNVKYINDIVKIKQLSAEEQRELLKVQKRYAFRINDYYLNLINWNDPDDPIRKLAIPQSGELNNWGKLDACNEKAYTPFHGLQHKYRDTALMLVGKTCFGYCRYCFRKRLFIKELKEPSIDLKAAIGYIKNNNEINNVLLTGGDPFVLSTNRLKNILKSLFEIDHVRIVRIGTKSLAFNPSRILNDPELLDILSSCSSYNKKIYVMHHFTHPNELTDDAKKALDLLCKAGVISTNQCPLIKGINDNSQTLAELFMELSFVGCQPYYLFQGRPTIGNAPFRVPIMEGFKLFHGSYRLVSGLAKRARYVMSHETGKIEILIVSREKITLRYHRAIKGEDYGRILECKADPDAYWLDDLKLIDDTCLEIKGPPYGPD